MQLDALFGPRDAGRPTWAARRDGDGWTVTYGDGPVGAVFRTAEDAVDWARDFHARLMVLRGGGA